MLAKRLGRPGVKTWSVPDLLRRGEVFPLVRRERLVLGPALGELLVLLLGALLGDALVVFACLAALLGRQGGPALHTPLHALLALHVHGRVAVGDAYPVAPAVGLEARPVGLERGENHLLVGGELGPGGTAVGCPLLFHGGRLARGFFLGLREATSRHAKGKQEEDYAAQHHSSAPRCLSQFWNPRSR